MASVVVVVIVVTVVAVAVALLFSFLWYIRRRRRRQARLVDQRSDLLIKVDANHQCFQLQRLPSAPQQAPTITIYLANGETGCIVSTATVWIAEVLDANKKYQTFDILKSLYLTQQNMNGGKGRGNCGNYVCVVNGKHRMFNEVVAPHVEAGTVVYIWPKSAWADVVPTLDPDRPG